MKKSIIIIAGISLSIMLGSSTLRAQEQTELTTTPDEATAGLTAQNDQEYLPKGFWANWSLIGTLGTQFYYGENDKYLSFKEKLSFPAFDIFLNKSATPVFGFGLGLEGLKVKGLAHSEEGNPYAAFRTPDLYGHVKSNDYYWQKGNYLNTFIYASIDIDNLIAGYKADRFYGLSLYAGGGIAIGFDEIYNRTAPTFNAGLINSFRLSEKVDLVVNLRGAIVGDDFDGESRQQEPLLKEWIDNNFPLDGIFGVTAGINYRFGKRKSQVYQQSDIDMYEALLADNASTIDRLEKEGISKEAIEKDLNDRLAQKQAELDAILAIPKTPDPVKNLNFRYHINFDLDKAELTNREIIDLQYIAEVMKLDESKPYFLIGYADQQTGSASRNEELSKNRVEAVYQILTETYGIKPEQLHKSFEGGVDTMFLEDSTLSRCVVIYSQPQE